MKDRHSSKHAHDARQTKPGEEGPEPSAAGAPSQEGVVPVTPAMDAPPPAEKAPGKSEAELLKEQLLRLQADFENFRKRTQRDQAETALRANEHLLRELLPVLDHFELGLQNAAKSGAPAGVMEGLKLVLDQFMAALRKFGVEPVLAENQPFDPNFQEAITYVPSDSAPAETVITQTRRGYVMGGKLLRAAQVVVSSGPAAAAPAEEKKEG